MVWSHEHSPRFSYGRDFRPRGVFSYSPAFWANPHAAMAQRSRSRARNARAEGEDDGRKQMMMTGGIVLGVVAVGALVWMAAKKQ